MRWELPITPTTGRFILFCSRARMLFCVGPRFRANHAFAAVPDQYVMPRYCPARSSVQGWMYARLAAWADYFREKASLASIVPTSGTPAARSAVAAAADASG